MLFNRKIVLELNIHRLIKFIYMAFGPSSPNVCRPLELWSIHLSPKFNTISLVAQHAELKSIVIAVEGLKYSVSTHHMIRFVESVKCPRAFWLLTNTASIRMGMLTLHSPALVECDSIYHSNWYHMINYKLISVNYEWTHLVLNLLESEALVTESKTHAKPLQNVF